MPTQAKIRSFYPGIPGLESLLKQPGFTYYPESGLNMVVFGPAGAGKSILALQMAVNALAAGKQVIYLTKDTPARVLYSRISEPFAFFGIPNLHAKNWRELGDALNAFISKSNTLDPSSRVAFADFPFIFLDEACKHLLEKTDDAKNNAEETPVLIDKMIDLPFFGFVNFNEIPSNLGRVDRYIMTHSVYDALGYLRPELTPLFQEMKRKTNALNVWNRELLKNNKPLKSIPELVVICDSLSPGVLEENMRLQARYGTEEGEAVKVYETKPIFLFLLESETMPTAMSVSFPPDVQIQLALRKEPHDLLTPTIRLVKTRFQPSLREPTPYVISGYKETFSTFLAGDFINLQSFANKLTHPTDEISAYLRTQLSSEAQTYLANYHGSGSDPDSLKTALVKEFNRLIDSQLIHGAERFEGVILRAETLNLLAQNPQGYSRRLLNRLLLEDAYPQEISRNSKDNKAISRGNVHTINVSAEKEAEIYKSNANSHVFLRKLGVEVFPPLSHGPVHNNRMAYEQANKNITFEIPALDEFTGKDDTAGLAAGGCTLLITQNRCGATPLSLHYLLGQIGKEREKGSQERGPRNVLYISFSEDLEEILDMIWRHPRLRNALIDVEGKEAKIRWDGEKNKAKGLDSILRKETKANLRQDHRLYEVKLHAKKSGNGHDRLLNIFLPDFSWITPEEAMNTMVKLIESESGGSIDRIVLDRVGRLLACWPLVQNAEVFIASLVAYCNKHHIELMLVDDTAKEDEETGLFHSHWMSMAHNVIRLRRVPFHGTETVSIELVSVGSSKNIQVTRPYELCSTGLLEKFDSLLVVQDTFKGYIRLASGEPIHCKIKVDLSYDSVNTPLAREVQSMSKYLSASMDGIEVLILGRGEWAGINSAFSNLSSISRDTCHIVAIDGIWLPNLLKKENGKEILHLFGRQELEDLLPEYVKRILAENSTSTDKRAKSVNVAFTEGYVTKAHYTATFIRSLDEEPSGNKIRRGNIEDIEDTHYAIPMRHNWGVLAVTKLSPQYLENVFGQLRKSQEKGKAASNNTAKAKKFLKQELPTIIRNNGTAGAPDEVIASVLGVLFGPEYLKQNSDLGYVVKNNPVSDVISGENNDPLCSWEDIANFRTGRWNAFWRGGWLEHKLESMLALSQKNSINMWLALFPRIDLFGIATTSEESITSFFLELLLAEVDWKILFGLTEPRKPDGKQMVSPALLEFDRNGVDNSECKEGFIKTLALFYRLLSPRQRRQLGIGSPASQSDIGTGLSEYVFGAKMEDNPFSAWPRQICLLSREWITTVQDLMPRFDIRESVTMKPLPSGRVTNECTAKCNTIYPELRKASIPVAGTWYLGVLNGGNMDLAPQVMKALLSEEQEEHRLLDRSGAPVSRKFYQQATPKGRDNHLPYADVIGKAVRIKQVIQSEKNHAEEERDVFIPFERSQIKEYLKVCPILYALVRDVMKIQTRDESVLCSGDKGCEVLVSNIRPLVELSFRKLQELGVPVRQTSRAAAANAKRHRK